jgi:hypothetical protein
LTVIGKSATNAARKTEGNLFSEEKGRCLSFEKRIVS